MDPEPLAAAARAAAGECSRPAAVSVAVPQRNLARTGGTPACAQPQAAGEALAVTLTGPSPRPCDGGVCTVFVYTLRSFPGNFVDGLASADGICQVAAHEFGMDGTYKGWLSDDTASPSTRFTRAERPYVLPTGARVAPDWNGLTIASLQSLENAIVVGPGGQPP
jgi:hypothetical protein